MSLQLKNIKGAEEYVNIMKLDVTDDGFLAVADDLDEEAEAAELSEHQFEEAYSRAGQGVALRTYTAYKNLAMSFAVYCWDHKWIPKDVSPWLVKPMPKQMDLMIVCWVMDRVDDKMADGSARSYPASSGCYGAKMRSALTHFFAFEGKRGHLAWDSDLRTGNPSISVLLSSYMRGMWRRKVQQFGETPISSRAISANTLQHLFKYHLRVLEDPSLDEWASVDLRLMMRAIITVAFICFLRIDEALTLQVHEVEIEFDDNYQLYFMVVRLHHRKTHQLGGIKPFVVYALPDNMAHLCPVRAMSAWRAHSRIKDGFLFRGLTGARQELAALKSAPLRAERFIVWFRLMLSEIKLDGVYGYGGHSLRRGGVQWCHIDLKWPLRKIVVWGGWSTSFNSKTVHRYLIGANDGDIEDRDENFLLGRTGPTECHVCGR